MRARKQDRDIPDTSGVYQIRCKRNGKIYVGSAVNLRARWDAHRRDLQRGSHHNPYLQHAWNRYRESAFEFLVLEYVDVACLLHAEQIWIDRTVCINRRFGYNIKLEATCPGFGVGRTWLGFRDPSGKAVTIVNLSDFCRRNGLNAGAMHSLSKGQRKLKSHKGWTHVNSVRQRDYIKTHDGFVDPDGRLFGPIRNLAAFCNSHDCRCKWPNRVASRMDPRPRQEEITAPGAHGIHRSRRRSRQNHESFRFLPRLRPMFGSHVRT